MNNKLQAKDLINIGIFTALYFVIFFATGCMGYIPILMVLVPFVCPIVAGIPMMLYVTKVNKFGMITITGVICGLLFFATGHSWYPVVLAPICGLLYDLILKAGKYKSAKAIILGYGVFSIWLMAMLCTMAFATDSYLEMLTLNYGADYVATMNTIIPTWSLPFYGLSAFIGGIVGGLLGKSILKKHFKKAGVV